MHRTLQLIGGLGLGAGLMYFLDPRQGRRRRALVRDQFVHLSREACDAADVTARDAQNRARGLWAEAKAAVTGRTADDRTLAERVRSHLGRCVSHPHAIAVAADGGTITLSGPVLDDEVDTLLDCVERVPGVSEVEARLEVHDRADDHPSLQGGVPRTGARSELFQANWSPTLRLAAGALGLCLMSNCLARRDVASVMLGTLGFGMFLRAATNTSASELMARAIPTSPAEGSRELMTAAAAGPVM